MTAELPAYSVLAEFCEAPVRVLWNDWPVVDRDTSGNENVLLNPFIVEGRNVMRVLVAPIQEPAEQWVKVALNRGDIGSDSALAKTTFRVHWEPALSGFSRSEWFEIARHEIFVRKAYGRWAWQDARLFRIEDEPAARARVAALHDALVRKDVDAFVAMCAPKLDELARSTGRNPIIVREMQRVQLRTLFANPLNVFDALNPDDLEFHSGAGGRLVGVRLPDGSAPLHVEDGTVEIRVVLSHLDTGFEIVR